MKTYSFQLPLKTPFFSLQRREIEIWTDLHHETFVEYAPFPGLHHSLKRYRQYLLSEFNYFQRGEWKKKVRDLSFYGFLTSTENFSAIKVKCGRNTLKEDIHSFHVLSKRFPMATFRLDANQSWTSDELKKFCQSIDLKRVDYFEEPTKNSHELCGEYPIALDETILKVWPHNAHIMKEASALVVKPHLYGHIDEVLSLFEWAGEREIPVVLSSLFNSSVGTQNLLRLACLCSGSGPHGLAPFFHLDKDCVCHPLKANGPYFFKEEIERQLELRL